MDAITRISCFFPTNTLTVFVIVSNVIINDVGHCQDQQRQLMIALLIIFCILNFMSCFTDTYTASNGQKYWVFIMPFYGPLCFSLPTDQDKDRVYEFFYLKIRDYIHALASMTTFLLIIIFTNPICMCLFPSYEFNGTSRFDPAIVRTVPIVIAIIMAMIMVCLGPPRQMLGFQNVPETGGGQDRHMADNPIYNNKYPPPIEGSIPEGEEEMDEERPPEGHQGNYPPSNSGREYNRPPSSREGGGYRTPPHDVYSNGGGRGGRSHRNNTPSDNE